MRHVDREAELELACGYGSLDRFDVRGDTQFFQSRIQLLV